MHLVGGGWRESGDPEVYGRFIAEASARAAGSSRMVPRLGVIVVAEEDADDGEVRRSYRAALEAVGPCDPIVTVVAEGEQLPSSVLSDIDGLLVGGGLTPAYHHALEPLYDEVRLLVADGLPYLGFSAGAMIAAEHALIGGWRIDGIPVCPSESAEDLEEVTIVSGLGLVDLAIDVHAAQWGTLSRLVAATQAGLVPGGVAIDEGTVLIVGDELAVAGAGNVWQIVETDDGVAVATLGGGE
ncbi:peptidase S51 [Schumannella sp. 10F1B-5-1]|nr:peptidase S51 [Schumannella sp. 10F1B-5-1]